MTASLRDKPLVLALVLGLVLMLLLALILVLTLVLALALVLALVLVLVPLLARVLVVMLALGLTVAVIKALILALCHPKFTLRLWLRTTGLSSVYSWVESVKSDTVQHISPLVWGPTSGYFEEGTNLAKSVWHRPYGERFFAHV